MTLTDDVARRFSSRERVVIHRDESIMLHRLINSSEIYALETGFDLRIRAAKTAFRMAFSMDDLLSPAHPIHTGQ